MKRRAFMQAAAAVMAVGHGLQPAHGRGLVVGDAVRRFFFDERFPRARRLAAQFPGSPRVTPVRGDVTDIWHRDVALDVAVSATVMGGVTTESFPFCLEVLARDKATTDLRIERLDRDLHLWTLHTFTRSRGNVTS